MLLSIRRLVGPSLLFLALLALPGAAAALPPVGETPYSGRFTMNAAGQAISGRMYRGHDAERREITVEGTEQIFILRPLQAEALMIMPSANMALRMPLPPDPGLAASEAFAKLEPEVVGEEVVAGEDTTIYRTTRKIDGRFWITDDGIIMRMEADTPNGRFTMEVLEVTRGEQDASLFEAPPGIQVMDAGAMGKPPAQ